jgi:putative ABC transport system substrate-binding protein
MKRLAVALIAFGLLAAPTDDEAQTRPRRVGLLGPAEEPRFSEIGGGLRRGLREQGFPDDAVEILGGRVERGDRAGARAAVQDFVRRGTDVAFVIGSVLAKVVREVAPELPIVFVTPGDPVAAGLVSSFARPGGNMTAMTFEYPELSGKRLELLRELAPSVRRVLVLYDPRDPSPLQGVVAARKAAPLLGITLFEREARALDEIRHGLAALGEVDALLGISGGLTSAHYATVIRAAHARKRPTVFPARTESTKEALATYGANDANVAQEAARLVAKILRGANAGELPIERPTRLSHVINLKTAKALGLTIPQSVLLRADEIIQ